MIEFIEAGHIYLNSWGVIIPSVSQLVQYATGDDYSHIPKKFLYKACEFGTDIHKAIEVFFKENKDTEFSDPYKNLAYREFKRLYSDFIITPLCEVMVDYKERYCGRIDCLQGDMLIDFKTNTNINIPHLEWQLSLYAMALESKGIEVNELKCLWLPKRKSGKWISVKRKSNEELLELLERYENSRNNEN